MSGDIRWEIESAVQAGKGVAVHERAINAHGALGVWVHHRGSGNGAGAYLIEGKGNGAIMAMFSVAIGATMIAATTIAVVSGGMGAAALALPITQLLLLVLLMAVPIMALWNLSPNST